MNTLVLADLQGLLQLSVVGLLCRNASLATSMFFLQWVSDSHVEGRGRNTMELLDRDVTRLLLGASDLILLLNHDRREPRRFG